MTADEIFTDVMALMYGEEGDKDQYPPFLSMLNIVLAETYDLNNAWRRMTGKDELTQIPRMEQLTDEVDYEPRLLRMVIPYGVAGMLYAEDDDTGMGDYYRSKYEAAKSAAAFAEFTEVDEII